MRLRLIFWQPGTTYRPIDLTVSRETLLHVVSFFLLSCYLSLRCCLCLCRRDHIQTNRSHIFKRYCNTQSKYIYMSFFLYLFLSLSVSVTLCLHMSRCLFSVSVFFFCLFLYFDIANRAMTYIVYFPKSLSKRRKLIV